MQTFEHVVQTFDPINNLDQSHNIVPIFQIPDEARADFPKVGEVILPRVHKFFSQRGWKILLTPAPNKRLRVTEIVKNPIPEYAQKEKDKKEKDQPQKVKSSTPMDTPETTPKIVS